jgi:hypothetical protein
MSNETKIAVMIYSNGKRVGEKLKIGDHLYRHNILSMIPYSLYKITRFTKTMVITTDVWGDVFRFNRETLTRVGNDENYSVYPLTEKISTENHIFHRWNDAKKIADKLYYHNLISSKDDPISSLDGIIAILEELKVSITHLNDLKKEE